MRRHREHGVLCTVSVILDEQLVFAIYHTRDMLEDLLGTYLAGYKADRE